MIPRSLRPTPAPFASNRAAPPVAGQLAVVVVGAGDRGWLVATLVVLGVLYAVVNVVEVWWVVRNANPDRGARRLRDWDRVPAIDVGVGDVVLSQHLGPRAQTVIEIATTESGRVAWRFRSGKHATIDAHAVVRRHAAKP